MKIFMYVPGMPFDGNTISEGQSLGGSETMGYYVAKGLAERGHSVFCFCNVPDMQHKEIDGVHYLPIGEMSKQYPFGVNFEKYTKDVPCDVILGQRNPGLFAKPTNSKINLWWTHDLALKRFQPHLNAQLWNIDRVLGVSKFHTDQIKGVYDIPDEFLGVLPNGIDLGLWSEGKVNPMDKKQSKTMLYSSRPERGLENLVAPGGIMDRLFSIDPEIRLVVCGYDNTTPEMEPMYHALYQRCHELPNVQNLGHLSKKQLATVQAKCWIHVYPTQFEETSCITAMEQQAAGTPFVCTNVGALPETLENAGVYFADLSNFEKAIQYLSQSPGKWDSLHRKALKKAKEYDIALAVDRVEEIVAEEFEKSQTNPDQMFDHYLYTSDIAAAKFYAAKKEEEGEVGVAWLRDNFSRLENRFKTYEQPLYQTVEFYEKSEARNTEIGNTHGMESPANLLRMARLQPVIKQLAQLPSDAQVLDYGCCVGQVSFALKSRFPAMRFTCVDISEEQTQVGLNYAKDNNIEGMNFYKAVSPIDVERPEEGFDAILALEVVEHVWDYNQFLSDISSLAKPNGIICVSTPFGPFEQNSEDPDPLYQHLHNFEERDIKEICDGKKDLEVTYVADAPSKRGECLGNYVWTWEKEDDMFRAIDYERKIQETKPRHRVSCCMITRPDGDTLQKCLKSVKLLADEIIVGVDDPEWFKQSGPHVQDCYDSFEAIPPAYAMLDKAGARYFPIESPTVQGFDAARNETISVANGEWVVWIDDDETYIHPERTNQFVRNSMFDSFGVPQHHFAAEPLGLLKTDYPSRLFRNNKGIKFYGVVHEHPELVYNEGAGRMFVLPPNTGCIMHNAYDTEMTRRRRFVRNFSLMERDREKYPDRKLGRFLWIRDLAHKNRFEYEQIGQVTQEMVNRSREAIDLWREVIKDAPTRMASESMQYITECVNMITNGGGYEFRMALDLNSKGVGDDVNSPLQPAFVGKVETKQDLLLLQSVLIKEKADSLETINYF